MTIAIVLVLPIGLGFLGDLFWGFDLIANYRPHLGLMALIAAPVMVWFDRETAGVLLFGGLVGAAALLPALVGSHPVPAGDTIEIVGFNVGVSNPRRADVAGFLANELPDLVFLFESSFEWEDAMQRAGVPLTLVTEVPRGRVAGVTVLASDAIDPVALEVDIGGEAAAVMVTIGDARVDVIGVHPPSPTTGARSSRRDAMLDATGEWIVGRAHPVVVVGDFNATPSSAAHRELRWSALLADSLAGEGLQFSWPDGWGLLAIPIDHVLYTRDLGSTDRRTGPSFGSAHRPVLVSVGPS